MKIRFDDDLENLKSRVIEMAVIAQRMIELANCCLLDNNHAVRGEVYELEGQVNHLEVEIEQSAVTLIALHQPAATDLRLIISVIHMINQLERLGDLAVNIVKCVPDITPVYPNIREEFKTIADLSSQMVKSSLEAFVQGDAEKAMIVCSDDDKVDNQNRTLLKKFIHDIKEGRLEPETGIEMILISKHYERIGDTATNLAEEVVFYIKGKSIKHHIQE